MTFTSTKDKREKLQGLKIGMPEKAVGFGETFQAALGMSIDEDMSISGMLNREGWEQRRQLTAELIESGQVNRDDYTDRRGRFDYNRLADSGLSDAIKTDDVLRQERNDTLAKRREYAESVLERGNGMAQFLGMANAFVLDPINIATYPIATAGSAVKGLGAMARAGVVARNEAALAIVAETGIQALVYEHKQDIESPYTMLDAIQNITVGALGAAAVGGAIGGISGYFRKAAKIAEGNPDLELQAAPLSRLADDLEQNPLRQGAKTEEEIIQADAQYLRDIEAKRQQVNNTALDESAYQQPFEETKPDSFTITSDQAELLERNGLKTDYDRDIQQYNQLKEKMAVVDGEVVNADDIMKQFDSEIKGLEEVKVCSIG